MVLSSSQDLHPRRGARYVFQRVDGPAARPGRYEVDVFAAGGVHRRTTVTWDDAGAVTLEPPLPEDALRAEVLKLARVVKRTGQTRLTRWRE